MSNPSAPETGMAVAIPKPQEQVIPSGQNLLKVIVLIALLLGSFWVTQKTVIAIELSGWPSMAVLVVKWLFVAVMAIWTSMLVLGMGILSHEAVHRILFRAPFWNELVGGLLAALALMPFHINRQIHLTHHAYAHQPELDPENEFHNHSFLYSATVGSLVALGMHYRLLFRNLLRIRDLRYTERVLLDILFVTEAGVFYFGLIPALGWSLSLTVIPMLLALPMVFAWRALSDHYGIPAIERAANKGPVLDVDEESWHRDREKRQREVTGWVVRTHPWLEWLWSNVNYHEVHHKYPWLSHVYLRGIFEATCQTHPYLVVKGYWHSLNLQRQRHYYESPETVRSYLSTS